MIAAGLKVVAATLVLVSVGCSPEGGSASDQTQPSNAAAGPATKKVAAADAKLTLRAKLEFRPIANHSEFALTLAKGPLPPDITLRMQTIGNLSVVDEAVFIADDLSTLKAWSADFAQTLPATMQVAYERIAPTKPVTLTDPVHKGWQLHFVRTDDGFAAQGATGRLRRATYQDILEILVDLTKEDGKRFGDLSGRLVDRKLAIVMGDRVLSAPTVRERIDGGSIMVTPGAADGGRAAQELLAKLAGVPASEVRVPDSSD